MACRPMSRVMCSVPGASCVAAAPAVPEPPDALSSANSGVCLPFCSKTMVAALSLPSGVAIVTSSGVLVPTNLSGLTMVIAGPPARPATT